MFLWPVLVPPKLKVKTLPGPEVIKHFSCSTQLKMKVILLINAKIVGILTFISRSMTSFGDLNLKIPLTLAVLI